MLDGPWFDDRTRQLTALLSRRRLGLALAALGYGSTVGFGRDAGAKRKKKKKKKKCKPACTGGAVCQKRQCVCPAGQQRCQEQCISDAACCGNGDCDGGALCESGACVCPADQERCDGVCTLSERICGEICCPEDLACFVEGCTCEEVLCRCGSGRTFCSTPDFDQCCLSADVCDPLASCVTDTCSAGNDVCTAGAAFCGGGDCLCTTSADAEEPFCADFSTVAACPSESQCATSDECGEGETCANVRCCQEDAEFFGLCLPSCLTRRTALAKTDRVDERRRLERTLHLEIAWSGSR